MTIDFKTIGEAVGGIIAGFATFTMIRRNFKDKERANKEALAKKAGLEENPRRCIDHSERLLALERGRVEIFTQIAEVNGKVDVIKDDVEKLLELHLKP